MSRVRRAGLAIVQSRLVCAAFGKSCIYCHRKTLGTVGWGPVFSHRSLHLPLCPKCREEQGLQA